MCVSLSLCDSLTRVTLSLSLSLSSSSSPLQVPLARLVELKDKYKFRLMLDESFSFGALGATGRGVTELFDVPIARVEILTVSLAHALASIGGACVGTSEVVDHQRLSGAVM